MVIQAVPLQRFKMVHIQLIGHVHVPMHSIRQCVCPSPYVLSHELKHLPPSVTPRSLLLVLMNCPVQHAFQRVKEERMLARRSTWGESHSIVNIMPLNNLWVVIHRRQDCARSHQPRPHPIQTPTSA